MLIINKLRTYYFFSPTCNLDEFLKTEVLNIRITIKEDWDNYIAFGTSSLFADCTCSDYVNICIRYSKDVILYRQKEINEIMKLKVTTGILRGKQIDTSRIHLSSYGDSSISFPPETYLSSELFPLEWMEIFKVTHGFHFVRIKARLKK